MWYFYQYKTKKRCNEAVQMVLFALNSVLDKYKTQETRNEAVKRIHQGSKFGCPETQETYDKAVKESPWTLEHVPDQFITQEMCNEAVQSDPWVLEHVSDPFVTQKMCNEAVKSLCPVVV